MEFPVISENKVVYRFYTDPFPNLKGKIDCKKLDDTYISFKINHILGKGWKYKTTEHLWKGGDYTEFEIERN